MTQIKTRIWRGGVPGMSVPEQPARAEAVTERHTPEIPPPPLAVLPTVVRIQPSPLHTTRIMPVEELLGRSSEASVIEPSPQESGEEQPAPASAREDAPLTTPRPPRGKRSMRPVIVGLFALTLGIWVLPLLRGEPEPMMEPKRKARPPATAAHAVALPAQNAARESTTASKQQPRPPEGRSRTQGRTEQRGAADALASGDYPLALVLYDALASRHPDQPAYAEAARILRQRTERVR